MNQEEMQRLLLEKLGLTYEELPEPVPPTDVEIRRYVVELLDIDKAGSAADVLSEWPNQAVPALRDVLSDRKFLETIRKTEPLHKPLRSLIDMLCKSHPGLIVEHLEPLMALSPAIATVCLETSFAHSANNILNLFDQLISREQQEFVIGALVGIRKAVWKQGLIVNREDQLYQLCLRLCSPLYPSKRNPTDFATSDPATFVCQSFGTLAEVDLAKEPYFSLDNPHFKEVLIWLPTVVAQASPELIRAEFARAVKLHDRDIHTLHTCKYFFPLAALKLGEECRIELEQLLSRDRNSSTDDLRGCLTKALAIVACGRDPLADAWDADRKGEFDSLNQFEQAILLANAFDGEVRNGGILQFLFNSAGVRSSETLESLRLMGELAGQELLQAGIDAVKSERETTSPHEAARLLGTSYLNKKFGARMDDLAQAYDARNDCDLRTYSFVLERLDQFRKTTESL